MRGKTQLDGRPAVKWMETFIRDMGNIIDKNNRYFIVTDTIRYSQKHDIEHLVAISSETLDIRPPLL